MDISIVDVHDELKYSVDIGWRIRAKDLKLNMRPILEKAELPLDLFDRRDAMLTVDEYFRLFKVVDDFFPDTIYALEFEKVLSVESLPLPLYAILHSKNLKECLPRFKRFEKISSPSILNIKEEKNSYIIDIEFQASTVEPPSCFIEFSLLTFVKLARLGTRKRLKPLSVISTTEMDPQAYFKYFGVFPKKGDVNRLVFSKEDAEYPFVTYDENIWKMHEKALQDSVDHINKHISYCTKVQSAILQNLSSGRCSIEDIAEKLNVSKRTLQRNLKEESTSFSDQLNSVRGQRARYYLKETNLSCEEISSLLGYDYPNSFTRAFTQWTGTTPQNYRTTK